jgi:hypothetical protein
MWKSPYIWVRNDPDNTGAKQHIHENPEFGQTNYVYVKLHNDFDSGATGQLKLYYAEASTGLTWPGDWTEFSDNTVNIGAHATLLTPATWNPPGTGHFCLLARWDTPNAPLDPMTFAEGASVNTNTRNNNNIVWRNVNVVNLEPDFATEVPSFKVPNNDREPKTFDLAIELGDGDNFLRKGGTVLVDLGGLLDNWQSNGARGDGANLIVDPIHGTVAKIVDTSTGTSTILGIPMTSLEVESINLILTAPFVLPDPPFPPADDDPEEPEPPVGGGDHRPLPNPSAGTFSLDVVQIDAGTRIGGIAYQIQVRPTGGSGAVPAMTVVRNPGVLTLDWGDSCSPSDVDYAVYEGDLGDFTSHVPLLCNTGGLTTADVPEPATNKYYLIVPTDGLADGSYGKDGNGIERPGSLVACRPHAVISCP